MALRESGSPLADADPGPPYDPDGSLPWNGGGEHDDRWFWLWMTPVYLALAAPVLYLLYALGII